MVNKNKLLIFSPYIMPVHNVIEVALAYNSKWRGVETKILCCDKIFDVCDMFRPQLHGAVDKPQAHCNSCHTNSDVFFRKNGLNVEWLSSFLLESEKNEIDNLIEKINVDNIFKFQYNGVAIGEFVESSVYSHFRINSINTSNEPHVNVFKKYIKGGIYIYQILKKIFDEFRPTSLILFNARMSYTRIALELALARKIEVTVHERGFLPQSLSIFKNCDCLSLEPYKILAQKWENVPLKVSEAEVVRDLIVGFEKGSSINWTPFNKFKTNEKLNKFLNKNSNKKIISLFPSSTDEIAGHSQFCRFYKNQPDWIKDTISFCELNDFALIIRAHPNMGSSVSDGINKEEIEFITSLSENLPENVLLFMPGDEVSSYEIIKHTDIGLVFVSTLSIEMACRGIPVIAAGNPLWALSSAVESPASREEYFHTLQEYVKKNITSSARIEKMRSAYRLAYAFFKRWYVFLPFYKMGDPYSAELAVDGPEKFKPGVYPELDRLTEVVLGTRDPIPDPPPRFAPNAEEEETAALQEVLAGFEAQRVRRKKCPVSWVIVMEDSQVSAFWEKYLHFEDIYPSEIVISLPPGAKKDEWESKFEDVRSSKGLDLLILETLDGMGLADRLNNAVSHSICSHFVLLSARDSIGESYLPFIHEFLGTNPEVDILYSRYEISSDPGKAFTPPDFFNAESIARRNLIPRGSVISKNLWEKLGGYRGGCDEMVYWDFFLAAKCAHSNFTFMNCVGPILANHEFDCKDSGKMAWLKANNPSAFPLIQYLAARSHLKLPPIERFETKKFSSDYAFLIEEIQEFRRLGVKPFWSDQKLADSAGIFFQTRKWNLCCYVCELLLETHSNNKELLGVYSQALKMARRPMQAEMIARQLAAGDTCFNVTIAVE